MNQTENPSGFARLLKAVANVEPLEVKAVSIAFVYFFFLMASYFILRPLRDTMGTIYGVNHLQELFTGTFLVSFIVAPLYAGFASRIRSRIRMASSTCSKARRRRPPVSSRSCFAPPPATGFTSR